MNTIESCRVTSVFLACCDLSVVVDAFIQCFVFFAVENGKGLTVEIPKDEDEIDL